MIGLWGAGFARSIADWIAYRRTIKALAALTDPELADIGVARDQIEMVARATINRQG